MIKLRLTINLFVQLDSVRVRVCGLIDFMLRNRQQGSVC